ncbi:MAG: Xaa-Pro aminopeptidase [Colwellia sp.]|nr:Xaa-Pro aminopeptidase [Colwellia sp.]
MKHTLLNVEEFKTRRLKLLANIPVGSIAFFPAAKEITRSNDTEYAFCQNKNFYYLTGFNEPDALLILIKSNDDQLQSILFSRAKDPLQEIWHGRRIGQEKAKKHYGFDQCYTLEESDEILLERLTDIKELHYCFGDAPNFGECQTFDQQVSQWLASVKAKVRQGITAPHTLVDCSAVINEMRLIKSDAELDIMRQVNDISCAAHQRAMEKTLAGKFEYQIEAEILHEFARNGARFPAYASIVAGGDNANILHYTNNDDVLNDGELLLIDAGGELAGYAADITRTFPVNGKFTPSQRALYQLVLDVQNAVIEQIIPNINFAQLNAFTCEFLTKGLIELGILSGDLTALIEEKSCKKYFIHGLGHWLGLDVHDAGDYQVNKDKQQLRSFEPGMVMTIEPGLYIPLDDDSVDEKWRGIGIRIEDNILVTDQGHENLTKNAPKSIKAIESLMANAKLKLS